MMTLSFGSASSLSNPPRNATSVHRSASSGSMARTAMPGAGAGKVSPGASARNHTCMNISMRVATAVEMFKQCRIGQRAQAERGLSPAPAVERLELLEHCLAHRAIQPQSHDAAVRVVRPREDGTTAADPLPRAAAGAEQLRARFGVRRCVWRRRPAPTAGPGPNRRKAQVVPPLRPSRFRKPRRSV